MLLLILACSTEPTTPVDVVPPQAPQRDAAAPADVAGQDELAADPGAEPGQTPDAPVEPEDAPAEAPTDVASDPPPVEDPADGAADADPGEPPAAPDAGQDEPPEEASEEPQAAPTVSYKLKPTSSTLWVQVFKDPDTMGAGLSHDHVIAAAGWTGTATWNADDPSACALSIKVPVSKLVVDAPGARKAVGLDGTLDDGQRGDVKKNMLASDQLDGSRHKNISFVATSCDATSVTGDFSLHGVTRSITVPLTVDADAGAFLATGAFKINGSDYGVEPFTAMMGALKNQDRMTFTLKIAGSPS